MLQEQHSLWKNASPAHTLSGSERDRGDCYRINVPSLDLIGEYAKRKRSRELSCLVLRFPINQNPGKLRYLGDPSTVVFSFEFDR